MDSFSLEEKLRQINTEDVIWVIYLFIIFLSYYSNSLERRYFIYQNFLDKTKYRQVLVTIFFILLIVYIYFLKDSFKDLKKLKESDSPKKKKLTILSFIGSLLIAISGAIFLFIAIEDEELSVELAFN